MTVCIAALCSEGKSCVVGADRQITFPAMSLEYEHHDRKIDVLTSRCAVLSSGDSAVAAEVIEKTRQLLKATNPSNIAQIAESLRDVYIAIHQERAENIVLKPRGFTLKEFKEKGAQLPPQAYTTIDQTLFNFGLNLVEFLIVGDDSTGAHIFRVYYSGIAGGNWLEWSDRLGQRAIGSGASHAAILLAIEGQHRDLSLYETLYNVYRAKKNSEIAPGVGNATDLAVISDGNIKLISTTLLGEFDSLRKADERNKVGDEKLKSIYDQHSAGNRPLTLGGR